MRNEEMLRQKISEIYKRAKAEAQPYLDALVQIEGSGSNEEMLRQKIREIYIRAKAEAQPYLDALVQIENLKPPPPVITPNEEFRYVYPRGTRVEKISGPEWNGIVVGHYSSSFTPDGVVIECLAPGAKGQVHVEPAKRVRKI